MSVRKCAIYASMQPISHFKDPDFPRGSQSHKLLPSDAFLAGTSSSREVLKTPPTQTTKAAELVPLGCAPAGAEERSTSAILAMVLPKHCLKLHRSKCRPPLLSRPPAPVPVLSLNKVVTVMLTLTRGILTAGISHCRQPKPLLHHCNPRVISSSWGFDHSSNG